MKTPRTFLPALVLLVLLAAGCATAPSAQTSGSLAFNATVRPVDGQPAQYELVATLQERTGSAVARGKTIESMNGQDTIPFPRVVATVGGPPAEAAVTQNGSGNGVKSWLTVKKNGDTVVAEYELTEASGGISHSDKGQVTLSTK